MRCGGPGFRHPWAIDLCLFPQGTLHLNDALTLPVVQATTTVRGIPQEVGLTAADCMAKDFVVNLDDIQTISKSLLDNRVAVLSNEKMAAVRNAIIYALSL